VSRYVIIGNSAAGVTAAETIRRLDRSGEITIVDAEPYPCYSRCLLPYFLDGRRDEQGLAIRPPDFYAKLGLNTLLGQKVESVLPQEKAIRLADGTKLPYDKLLIATGASPTFPSWPGLETEGVYGLRTLDDAKRLLRQAASARRAGVIGAGFVGLETAWALYRRGLEVTVVGRSRRILRQQFDATAASIIMREMQAEGIRFLLGVGIKEIAPPSLWEKVFGRAGCGVILDNGDRLKAELVVVATGVRPNVDLLSGSGVAVNRGVVVDAYQATNVPDIYAAGDVAEIVDWVTGARGLSQIWPSAVVQGLVAGYNMAGVKRELGALIGLQNAVEFRDVPAIAIGLTQPEDVEDRGYEVLTAYQPDRNLYKKLVLRDDVIVGLILVGEISQTGVYAALMRKKANVKKYKDRLLRPDFGYALVGQAWQEPRSDLCR